MSNVEKSSCEFYWIAFSNLTIPATCGFVQGAGISSAWRLGRLSWSGSCQWPNCGLWMTVVSNIPTIIFIDISVVSPLHLKITRSWRETHFLSELKLFETTERALFCKLSAPVVSWTISSENGSLRGRPVRHGEKKNGRCLSRLHVCIWRCWKGFVQPTGWRLLVYYVYFPKQINPFQRGFQGFSIHIPEPLTLLTKQLFTHCLCACLAWKDQCWQENAGCFMSGNLAAFIFFFAQITQKCFKFCRATCVCSKHVIFLSTRVGKRTQNSGLCRISNGLYTPGRWSDLTGLGKKRKS